LLGALSEYTRVLRSGGNTCGLMSVLWSGVKEQVHNGYFVHHLRNGIRKWSKPTRRARMYLLMVWGCFWGDGRSDLYILDCDFESKKHGYSANSYIEVLDAELAGHHQLGLIFMQDNAPIHTARKVKDWFKEQRILCANWPPYSPDLNPIEHLWPHLKRMVLQMHPKLETISSEDDICEALRTALQEAWTLIGKDLMDRLIESMLCCDIPLFKGLVAGLPLICTEGGALGYKSAGRSRIHDSIESSISIN
jgi:hypothetical protein